MNFFNVEWVFKPNGEKIPFSPVIGGKLEGIPATDKKDAAARAIKLIMLMNDNIKITNVTEM